MVGDEGRHEMVCDHFHGKWVEAYAFHDQQTQTVSGLLVENIVRCHGVPQELSTDGGF